ncbi:hypothetical protein [Leptospira stimsonii]|uniref:Acyltransferase n=1 Tax=Leptospira stimsonii TaxID=2202203 RepID=A0A8B6RYN0_9LEPT|nr:hypothetical protein [Leptospira stimsonii]RHX86489.1 hypothetical protein DLM78_11805 [Leptospira stimsonii]
MKLSFKSLIPILSVFCFFPPTTMRALDPLDPALFYHSPSSPFLLNILKIRFPEKAEVRTNGNGYHWKVIPTKGRAWMLILREWEGPFKEESVKTLLRDLFPNSKDLNLPKWDGLLSIGAERKEIVSGNPLTVRYYLFQKKEKIVSVYLVFDTENKTISDFFEDPKKFFESISQDSL